MAAEIVQYRYWTRAILDERIADAEDRSQKRNLQLVSLAFGSEQLANVTTELLVAEPDSMDAIVRSLARCKRAATPKLWDVLHQTNKYRDESTRFRAAIALAYINHDSGNWRSDDFDLITNELVAMNPFQQPLLVPLLERVREQLLPRLEAVFSDRNRPEREQLCAANAIAFFAERDPERLAKLLLVASGPQYKILYAKYRRIADVATKTNLATAISKQPANDLDVESRIATGKERATSAITLLRLGEQDSIFQLFRYQDDPEAVTQFAHRCRARGVAVAKLFELLERVDQRRGPLDSDRQKLDDGATYALLLTLGEYSWNELPPEKDRLVERLGTVYEKDPSSCVHSATGWLLRRWGHHEVVERVDRTPLPYDPSGNREWFVHELGHADSGGQTRKLHMTFIVFQPSQFTIGSPIDAPNRGSNEAQHQVTLTRPFAVCDRELTWALWDAYEGPERRQTYSRQFSRDLHDDAPANGVDWFDAVKFCRWATDPEGMSETRQCYAQPASLSKDSDGHPKEWPLRLKASGFRLPTEAEWEFICRSGTKTGYSFGNDAELLHRYAWYAKNSGDWPFPTGELRPNLRGLYDVHGNVSEWCHDWYAEELTDEADPLGANAGAERVVRGGHIGSPLSHPPRNCQSSNRLRLPPRMRNIFQGFRVAVTLRNQDNNKGGDNR